MMNDEMKTTNETNEVERLRELLNRAIEAIPDSLLDENGDFYENAEHTKIKAELARLAPAPKEPVIKESLTTEPAPEWRIKEKGEIIEAEDQYNSPMAGWVKAPWVGDKIETAGRIRTRRPLPDPVPTQPPTQNEWRDLGPDEEICEGDEVFSLGMWIPVSPNLVIPINGKRKPEVRFRTRRLLPKQEEERLLKVMEYCRKWAGEHLAGHGKETFYARLGLLVDFATDLHRDEIQKLKEAKP
jgi:hypothetical protein